MTMVANWLPVQITNKEQMNNRLENVKSIIQKELDNYEIEHEIGAEMDPTTGGYLVSLVTDCFFGIFSDSNNGEVHYYVATGKKDNYEKVSLSDFIYACLYAHDKVTPSKEMLRNVFDLLDIFKGNVDGHNITDVKDRGNYVEVLTEDGLSFEVTVQEREPA